MSEATPVLVESLPGVVVVRVLAETINESNLSAIRSAVASAGEKAPGDSVALDMAKVGFMPSVSLGGLIQLSQLFKSRKQKFFLVGLQPVVREMLVLTRLDRVFEIRSDLAGLDGAPARP